MQKVIRAERDPEAGVWVATSDDVPGLATEAETLEALSAKLERMVPELLEANGMDNPYGSIEHIYLSVIPAKAGIQGVPSSPKGCKSKKCGARAPESTLLDSRLRGNDG